jgi:hypothetical protein
VTGLPTMPFLHSLTCAQQEIIFCQLANKTFFFYLIFTFILKTETLAGFDLTTHKLQPLQAKTTPPRPSAPGQHYI